MSNRLPVNKDKKFCYDIVLEQDFSALPEELNRLEWDLSQKKICIVTDSNVEKLYAKELQNLLTPMALSVEIFAFPAGEEHKNLETVQNLYEFLIGKHFTRKDVLFALGGGVVGDLTGFGAATFLRGIDFIRSEEHTSELQSR